MKVIILLLAVSLLVSMFFLFLYTQSSKGGQFDDTFSPGHRILYDEEPKQNK